MWKLTCTVPTRASDIPHLCLEDPQWLNLALQMWFIQISLQQNSPLQDQPIYLPME